MDLSSVSIYDWISLIIGITGAISACLANQNQLPASARRWLSRLGKDQVEKAVTLAAQVAVATPEQRRAKAVAYLQKVASQELGFTIPTSVANLLVEFVYQQLKKRIPGLPVIASS